MASPNTNYDDITATTIENRSGELADNVSDSTALFNRMKKRGNMRLISGGDVILQELAYAENTNWMRYSGMDPLAIQQQEEFTAAQFAWKQAACAVPMSGLDEIKNSGKEKYIDLMEARLTNAERTMKNNISSDFYSAGSLANQMGGLQLLVSDTPTTGTVGNIDASAQSWWQSICTSAASATATADIGGFMYDLWLQLVRGQDSPNLISSDNILWKAYNLSLTANQRFTNPELAELGFHNLLFQNAPVVLDGGQGGDCPARHMYFLNTDYLHFCTSKIRNFSSLGGKRFSTNQDASVQLIAWAGNATCSNRSLQGVLKGV
ncbi:MAG: phage major capsid protein [Nitrospira sp.]|nr:phage major capsid protein [Nitrospira sp.]